MMWRVTATSGQAFRMTIGKVIHLQQRPGLYLAGKIESGIVCVGDRLNLVDGETVVREVTCDAVEFVDVDMHRPELALIAVLDKSLVPGDAREGQTLASVPAGE
jgi:translation elongation factor EF-Tu-like GTPase